MAKILCLLTLLAVLLCPKAHAGLFFWDTNGSGAGSGSATPSGTWGVDAYWNTNGSGGVNNNAPGANQAWTTGASAVFAAGDDAVGAYTVTVSPNVQAADIHVDLGEVTFVGGPIILSDVFNNPTNRLLSVGHKDLILGISSVARYNTVLTGAYGIIRYKRGTMIFGAVNTYGGPTVVEGGILQLGVDNAIPTNSDFVLSNNDNRDDVFPSGSFTPSALVLDGYSQKLGTLTLTGPDAPTPRTIDFGGGAAALSFADSSPNGWVDNNFAPIDLLIVNYKLGINTLRFGTNGSGLTMDQLAQIHFVDQASLPGKIDGNGFVTPVLPSILSVNRSGPTQTDLAFSTIPGHTYRVQFKDDLGVASWSDMGSDIFAGGTMTFFTDASATPQARFYRVIALP